MKRTAIVGVLVVASVLVGAAGASVTISSQNPNPLAAAQGTMNDSAHLSVSDVNVSYAGLDATGVTVGVTNSDTVDHTANVSIAVVDQSGTVLESTSRSNVALAGNSTETRISLSFSSNHRVDSFDTVEVAVEELA